MVSFINNHFSKTPIWYLIAI